MNSTTRQLTIAAIQLDAQPAPVPERLAHAEQFVVQAVNASAQIAVLPEVFNTGYEYSDANYTRAEPIDGPTVTWMKTLTARTGIHLAGTLLLRDRTNIYNTMLLVDPYGRMWRYDKNYPWVWERAYFRPGRSVTVAETSLGRFGMLICWDAGHPRLWKAYAGRVDAMLVSSCPPLMHQPMLTFPDGSQLHANSAKALFHRSTRGVEGTFGTLLRRQSTWLGVPVVNVTATGWFSSTVPLAHITLAHFVPRGPLHRRYRSQLQSARLECGYFHETYVANAGGQVLSQVPSNAEGYALATVQLADIPPQPRGQQPSFGLSPLAYWADAIANRLLAGLYRQKTKHRSLATFDYNLRI